MRIDEDEVHLDEGEEHTKGGDDGLDDVLTGIVTVVDGQVLGEFQSRVDHASHSKSCFFLINEINEFRMKKKKKKLPTAPILR